MSRYGELYKVFQKPIGQNLDNDEADILNLKTKLTSLGRYQDKHKSGYIDSELNRGIRIYQSDRGLKADGVVLPGGETEATLLGEMIDPVKTENDRVAFVQAIGPAVPWIINGIDKARKAKTLWDIWKTISPSERQGEIDQMCDDQLEEDIRECYELQAKNGRSKAEVFEICRQTAMGRYARCRAGQNDDKGPLYNGE